MSAFSLALLASVIVSLISLSGGALLVFNKFSVKNFSSYLVSFAAGVMLSAAFLDLFPEALELDGEGDIFESAFFGIILFFMLERFLLWFHHHDSPHGTHPAAVLIILGDGVHNFIDGVVIATSFLVNPGLGLVTTLAVAAHEIPQEIADFGALVGFGMGKARALFFNFVSALTAVLGTIFAFVFFENNEPNLSMLLAFTAGMFTYIAASDLIPELHLEFKRRRSWVQILPFVFGIVIIVISTTFLEG